jgi:filamentous hemagglutinin family protein
METTRRENKVAACRGALALAACIALGGTLTSMAGDLPAGWNPGDGVGNPVTNGNTMTITAANFASFMEWAEFNIGSGFKVEFLLGGGDPNSRILNLVTGGDLSHIHGEIASNGIVFLVNPAGVTFHPGATLDVAGFYAAAANMSKDDFLAGDFRFTDAQGTVRVKPGTELISNVLHLIGRRVINEGTLKTADSGGIIGMFAGNEILIGEANGRVFVKIDGTTLDGLGSPGQFSHDAGGGIGVDNKGTIHASPGGRVFLGAGDMYSIAVRNTGLIDAPQGEVNLAGKGRVWNEGNISADVATFGGKEIHLNSDITDVESKVEFFDPVTLRKHIELESGEIIAHSTIDGLQDGLQDLWLTGSVYFYDAVGGINRLGALRLLDGSLFIGGPLIDTLGEQLYLGQIVVGEDATLRSNSLVTFGAPVNALSAGSHGLTVDAALLIDNRIGANNPLNHLIAKDITTINTNLIRTLGDQQYQGFVILARSSQLEALNGNSKVWFFMPLNALPFGSQGLTINGNARFDGQVGAGVNRQLAWLNITGNTAINTNLIRTTGHQTYGGNVVLGAPLVNLEATKVWFQSLVDAKNNGAQGVHVIGDAAFDGNVGSNKTLTSLAVDGNTVIRGVLIKTVGDQIYGSGVGNTYVLIDGDTVLRSFNTDIIFNSTIDDLSEGQSILLIDGNAFFHGLVGQNVALNSLEVLGTTLIDTSAITTTNLQSYAGAVDLASDATLSSHIMDFGSTIDGQHALVLNVGDSLRLGGDVGGDTRLVMLEINAGGITTIEGQQVLTIDDIRFNPLGTANIPDIATFAGMYNLLIESLNGSFYMGEHQKLSVLGDLTINVANGSATLGDLNSLGDMTVNAPAIYLQSRLPGQLLRFDGTRITDFGIDFVAGGSINFSTVPEALRPGFVLFSSSAGSIDLGGDGPFFLTTGEGLTSDVFFFGEIVLDLTALQTIPDNLAEALEGGDIELEDFVLPDPLRLIMLETLQNMNLNVRGLSGDEYGDRLSGRDIYDDSANMLVDDPAQRRVAINRLRRASVITVIDTYIDLFLDADRDPETGELTNVVDRRSQVRESFEAAWADYTATDPEPTAEGFRDYLQTTEDEHAELATYITGLGTMFQELSIMGLNRMEYESASAAVLQPILPAGLNWREMHAAINEARG